VIFTCEFLIKVVGDGFLFNRNAYLHNSWNVLDFIIVSTSFVYIPLKDFSLLLNLVFIP
jgi:hypothetical protein